MTAKDAAATSATSASQSATAAASSATNAAGSASTASTQAGLATTAKDAAATSATSASQSASAAASSASSASGSASTATTQAGIATSAKDAASGSATSAGVYAGQAAASATTASGHASSSATSLQQVQAIVGDAGTLSAAITTEATARASADGVINGKYGVKVDVNGYVSGFGLISEANNATPYSSFVIRADKFAIASPSGSAITPSNPFTVLTTATTVNGYTFQPGIYLSAPLYGCLLYTSPSPRDRQKSRMPSSA